MASIRALKEKAREMREDGMTKVETSGVVEASICATCKHVDSCVYVAKATTPIMHCEEFDTRQAEPSKAGIKIETTADSKLVSNLKGLCKNCEKRESCTFPKPESGVWHCEEYE